MHVSEFSVRRPHLTIVIFLMAIALGISSILSIPLSEDPTFPVSSASVVAVYPGATPEDMEQLVADPIEERLNELEDVESIATVVEDGLAIVEVESHSSTDPATKHDEVVREVNALRPDLPADLYRLDVLEHDLAAINILQVALVSENAPARDLRDQAKKLERRLERVPGVRTASRFATPEPEVAVTLDPGRMGSFGLAPSRVLQAVQSEGANLPGGAALAGSRRFAVRTSGSYRSVEDVRSTVIGGDGRSMLTLGDVADVNWGTEDPRYLGRWNGQRAVFVAATMKKGQRISAVRDRLWRELDAFEKELPAGITLKRPFDQNENVRLRLSRLAEDFLLAVLLVLITLLPLGWRASVVVMISLPLSLAIGVTLLRFTGFSINQLSIVGFVISLGLLVDDSIVVVENIARFLREGVERTAAAVAATRQITLAVLGCTATLIAAFLPLLTLPGIAGKYIRSLPAAVVYTIFASLLVSLTIVPFLASRVLSRHEHPDGNLVLRGLNRAIDTTYGRWLHRLLAAPGRTLLGAAIFCAATLVLVPVIGFSLFPRSDTPQFLVRVTAPHGSSLESTDAAVRYVEGVLRQRPEVRDVLSNVGHGNPFVYYNISSESDRANLGELFVLLRRWDTRRTPELLDSLQAEFDRYPAARIEVKIFEHGPPIDAPIALRVLGDDLDSLRAAAAAMQDVIESVPGTRNVTNPLQLLATHVRVTTDEGKAGLYGVPTVDVDRTVRMALAGFEAGKVREANGEEYSIRVRLGSRAGAFGERAGDDAGGGSRVSGEAPPLSTLDLLQVTSITGAAVPLRQVADYHLETSLPVIQHYDRERSATITATVRTGYNTDRVTREVLRLVGERRLPAGCRVVAAGEIESRTETFGGLTQAIIIAVFIIFAILILEFGDFRGMLIVASVIPLGIAGGLLALFFSGYTLSFTAMIGFVALIGIEIKNSILLVDFTNQLRAQGFSVRESVERAGRIRFLPILLTTMTAVGGLTPLALQKSSLYSPLALVLIGGLISSTLLARLVTPVTYLLLTPDGRAKVQPGQIR